MDRRQRKQSKALEKRESYISKPSCKWRNQFPNQLERKLLQSSQIQKKSSGELLIFR